MDRPAPSSPVEALKKLMRLQPQPGQQWSVFAFALNADVSREPASEALYAYLFPLGSFSSQEEARQHARSIIASTGYPDVAIARYGSYFPLQVGFSPVHLEQVNIDQDGKLIQVHEEQHRRQMELYEKQTQIRKEIKEEASRESDPSTLDHFRRNCYMALQYLKDLQEAEQAVDSSKRGYQNHVAQIREHHQRYPEHEKIWLEKLQEQLTKRGEEKLYKNIAESYNQYREQLLGL